MGKSLIFDIPAADGKIANLFYSVPAALQYAVGKIEHADSETRIPVF
jgi:hypothetical protein